MTEHDQRHFARVEGRSLAGPDRTTILAVGETDVWQEAVGEQPAQNGVTYIRLEDLNASMISLINPGLVLSPVVAKAFDCLDVSGVLQSIGFKGSYRAVTQNLPNPGIVRREVNALFPELDFGIMMIGKNGFYLT